MGKPIDKDDLEREQLLPSENAEPEQPDLPDPEGTPGPDGASRSLLLDGELEGLRSHWLDIQAAFVESPRDSVQDADRFIDELIGKLAEDLTRHRVSLQRTWNDGRGEDPDTENLRHALQEYRSFFNRLVDIEF